MVFDGLECRLPIVFLSYTTIFFRFLAIGRLHFFDRTFIIFLSVINLRIPSLSKPTKIVPKTYMPLMIFEL